MMDADNLGAVIKKAGQPMKAMILLGLNCGLGQTDVANLPLVSVDLKGRWIDYPRIKTAVPRRCPLWTETVDALHEAIGERAEPNDPAEGGLVFLTRFGHKWVRNRLVGAGRPATPIDNVQNEFQKVLKAAKVDRVGFYTLRHVFRTIADRAKDQIAADYIMDHVSESMASVYRERIDDDRLEAVVQVHDWLWPNNYPRPQRGKRHE